MRKEYQVTLMCTTGQYRPVSAIVSIEQESDVNLLLSEKRKKDIISKGIVKICQKRYWSKNDLLKYNYKRVKTREYVRE